MYTPMGRIRRREEGYVQKNRMTPYQTADERLVDLASETFNRDLEALTSFIAPAGRPPFSIVLKPDEVERRLGKANDSDWAVWRRQLEAMPDGDTKKRALAGFMQAYGQSKIKKTFGDVTGPPDATPAAPAQTFNGTLPSPMKVGLPTGDSRSSAGDSRSSPTEEAEEDVPDGNTD
jgi:hypothetical protein